MKAEEEPGSPRNLVADRMQDKQSLQRNAGAVLSLGLFLIALLPRVFGLGVFVTADEAKWIYRSAQFLGALLRWDLSGTMVNLTPGVTTTWLGSLGLATYYMLHRSEVGLPFVAWLASLPEFRADLDVLVAVRWPMTLLTSVSVVAFYHVARRLVAGGAALLFALSLALDPQFVALSRVLGHDAPAGLFIGLSLLVFLWAVQGESQEAQLSSRLEWGKLIGSGALAGLAWLSKSPAFFLIPFIGLVVLVEVWRRGARVRNWLLQLVVWGLIAWIVFVLVWPAGWQQPIGAPYAVVHNAFLSATDKVEAEAEGFWRVPNLGPFYYLVNGAFKLSLFAALGLTAWAWLALSRRRRPSSVETWILIFAGLFTVFLTLGGKRSNRYILPAWPALYLLAAVGFSQISNIKTQVSNRNAQYVIRGVLLLVLILPVLVTYPYYFPYFNPLVGGALTAPRLVKIGWGEGLDQVGRWLSGQPDAPALRVGSYYASALAPFFPGRISGVTASGLDYVVLYRKQVQGGYPSPTILRYFEAEEPLQTIRLGGIQYAWIYSGPGVQPAMANEAAYDIGILPKPLAFRSSQPYLPIGQEVRVDVLWLANGELPTAPSLLTLQALDDLSRRPGERSNEVFAESSAQLIRRHDGLILSQHKLEISNDLWRGSYGLLVDGRPLGRVETRSFILPPLDERLDANFGDQVQLVGYTFEAPTATLRLVWRAAPRAWSDYTVFVHLVDAAGNRLAGADAQPLVPTSQWVRGEVVVDERVVPTADGAAADNYLLSVGLYDPGTGQRLSILGTEGLPIGDSLILPIGFDGQVQPSGN